MKKLGKRAWLAALCSGMMLLSGLFTACSDGGSDEPPEQTGGVYSTLTEERVKTDAPATAGTITVSGGATYSGNDINAAWAAVKAATGDVKMTLAAGTYTVTENTFLGYSGAYNITISGEKADYGTKVLIVGNTGTNKQDSRNLVYMDKNSSGNLTIEYVTIKNEFGADATTDCQAEALATDGTGNLAVYNCSILSHQDTIRTVGKAWFYKCYIEGDVDFLWMDTAGTVALYEECVLRAVNDRGVEGAYFTAPRHAVQNKVGKGLVIYNSKLQAEAVKEGQKKFEVFLGRNPWSSSALTDYYNQVAIVSTPYYGTLDAGVWKSVANGTKDQQYVGFKADDYYAKSTSGLGAVLSTSVKQAEYSGRKNILNRVYNIAAAKFQQDATDKVWDIDAVITANNWEVSADSSKSLLDGETIAESKTYDFTKADGNGYTEATCDGFAHESGKTHAKGAAGNTITIPMTKKGTVAVYGYYAGYGTIKLGEQGEAFYDFNNGSTSTVVEKVYVNYTGEGTVTITAATATYITKVVVEYDDSLSYVPVTGIEVKADTESPMVGIPATLTASVSPDNATNPQVKWTSGNENVGTINEYTGVITFKTVGDVTFTATARDGSGASASVAMSPKEATWTSAEWYDSKDSSSSSSSGGGTGLGGSLGENNSVFTLGTTSGVTLGGVKKVTNIKGEEVSISTGIKMNSSGTVSFAVTKPGKVVVKTGYCKDSNATSDTLKITGTNGGEATAWTTNPAATPTDDATYTWTITAGSYKIERASGGYAPAIYYVRVDVGTNIEDFKEDLSAPALKLSTFETAEKELDLNGNTSVTQTVTATLENATGTPTVAYTSANASIATVNETTGAVTAVGMGSTTITATASFEGLESITRTYTIKVKDTSAVADEYTIDFTKMSGTVAGDYGKFSTDGKYWNEYGFVFSANGTLSVKVAGASKITLLNTYANDAVTITPSVTPAGGTFAPTTLTASKINAQDSETKVITPEEVTVNYVGGAGVLKFTFGAQDYLSGVKVEKLLVPATGVTVEPSTKSIAVDGTVNLSATVTPAGSTDSVAWAIVDNSTNVTITTNADGTVTVKGVNIGTATVRATAGSVHGDATISVSATENKAASVAFTSTTATVFAGNTLQLAATVTAEDTGSACTDSLTYALADGADATVATVTSNGLVSALKAGSVVVVATAGTKTATCTVTVKPNAIGQTYELTDLVTIDSYSSGYTGVYDDGAVSLIAVKPHSNDNGITQSSYGTAPGAGSKIRIAVASKAKVTWSSYKTSAAITVKADASETASVATDATISDSATFVINAQAINMSSDGTTGFLYTTDTPAVLEMSFGGACYMKSLKVEKLSDTDEPKVTSVTIAIKSGNSAAISKDGTTELEATVRRNYLNADTSVTWNSKNSAVASVSNGVVKGLVAGTADITATAGGVESKPIQITVTSASVTAFTDSFVQKTNGDNSFTITTTGSGGTIAYSSSNTDVASVNSSTGEVTILKAGYSKIIAAIGDATASYTLAVAPKEDETYEWKNADIVDYVYGGAATAIQYSNNTAASATYNGLYVLADSSGAKFQANTGNVQVNAPVKVYIPVSSSNKENTSITVTLFSGQKTAIKINAAENLATPDSENGYVYTIAGSQAQSYTINGVEGTYVLITVSTSGYFANGTFIKRTVTSSGD